MSSAIGDRVEIQCVSKPFPPMIVAAGRPSIGPSVFVRAESAWAQWLAGWRGMPELALFIMGRLQ